jgi:DNA polymerase III delta prime subunit
MRHHAFLLEADAEKGIATASAWVEKELGMKILGNPDIAVVRFGLLSVADARLVAKLASGAPFKGEHKVVIIAANRAYHEAQNALLKLFEEPPPGTYLFLIMPSLGGVLPTLRSRVSVLTSDAVQSKLKIPEIAEQFLKASKEKRTALIKKLASGGDDEERRENREEVIAIVNGVEAAAYAAMNEKSSADITALLSDISILRSNLYDRSAPVRMILEHLSLVIPRGLV